MWMSCFGSNVHIGNGSFASVFSRQWHSDAASAGVLQDNLPCERVVSSPDRCDGELRDARCQNCPACRGRLPSPACASRLVPIGSTGRRSACPTQKDWTGPGGTACKTAAGIRVCGEVRSHCVGQPPCRFPSWGAPKALRVTYNAIHDTNDEKISRGHVTATFRTPH